MTLDKPFLNKLFRLGFLFTVVLILADLMFYFSYPGSEIGKVFLATREQTPLTWVSSITLFAIAFCSAYIYHRTKSKFYYFLAAVFAFFSIDDATYLHERLTGQLQVHLDFMNQFASYSWVLIYFPIFTWAIVALASHLLKKLPRQKRVFVLAAVLGLGVALALDMLDGWVVKDEALVFCISTACNKNVTHLARLLEEFLEVVSFGTLAYLSFETIDKL